MSRCCFLKSSIIINLLSLFLMFCEQTIAQDIQFNRVDSYARKVLLPSGFQRPDDSVLFDYSKKRMAGYQLVLGPIEYAESHDGVNSGFQLLRSELMLGTHSRYVIDYDEQTSVQEVKHSWLKQLESNAMSILYECQNLLCGSIEGWKGYVYRYLSGESENQSYIVARNKNRVIAAYITMIGQQARLVVDFIEKPISLSKMHQRSLESGEFKIYFDIGSSDFELFQLAAIEQLLSKYDLKEYQIQVTGFADAPGPEDKNLKLATERASQVSQALLNNFKIPESKIIVNGFGEVKGKNDPAKEKYNSADRRVDVIFVKQKAV